MLIPYIFLIQPTIIFSIGFFWLNGIEIIRENHRQVKQLNRSIFEYFFIMLYLCYSVFKHKFVQKINNNVQQISNNKFLVSYVVRGKLYNMLVEPRRGPSRILSVKDENNNDITSQIIAYSGPNSNFTHSIGITPRDLGYQKMSIETNMGEIIEKGEFELLNI